MVAPIAALPLYDLPELAGATDALWTGLARALRDEGVEEVPAELTRGPDCHTIWSDPDLLFAQACGYPLARAFSTQLEVVATPCYRAAGCEGPTYRSFLVVPAASPAARVADLFGATAAVNDALSHSGMNALRALVAPLARDGRFFGAIRRSGSHRRSLALVAAGEVDVAAIDCVTYALLRRVEPPLLAGVRVLAETPPAPAPPFVVRSGDPDLRARVLAALRRALTDPATRAARETLLLDDVTPLPTAAYAHFLRLEADAERHHYPDML